jgi:hypothetical protein
VDNLVARIRELLDSYPTEVQVVTDVWMTLQTYEPSKAALLGAVAIVRLAKQPP